MSGNSINFDDKKIKKGDFYNKNKKIFNINDIKIKKLSKNYNKTWKKNWEINRHRL